MTEEKKQSSKVAAILIRGLIGVRYDIKDTLKMLNLNKKHACSVFESSPSVLGMMKKCKDYITWGEVSDETVKVLSKRNTSKDNVFKLCPPKGGFERKGIKNPFSLGGALGYRAEKINDLIKRMV